MTRDGGLLMRHATFTAQRPLQAALLALALLSCAPSSGVDPSRGPAELTVEDAEALCRFQEELLGDEWTTCDGEAASWDHDVCVRSPPVSECGFWTVGQFERCMRALASDACTEDEACAVPLCL